MASPVSQRGGKCANCGHAKDKHTSKLVHPCTVKARVGWAGNPRRKRPILGLCGCPKYEPIKET